MAKVVGISLGMTNSYMAVVQGQPVIIPNSEGYRVTPSAVAYTHQGNCLVGQIAKRQALINPENMFSAITRFIGLRYDEVIDAAAKVSYKVFSDSKGHINLSCPNIDPALTPEEISAQIIRKLADDASRYLGEKVTQAVLTVPVHFTADQRQAIKDAATIAGLEVLRLLDETTAACLAYQLHQQDEEQQILVFDLGGQTLDVTVACSGDGVFERIAVQCDSYLGGDDFNQKIVDWVADEYARHQDIDLRSNNYTLHQLSEAAEVAKNELSSVSETWISLPLLSNRLKVFQLILTRSKFEEMCSDLLERCRFTIQQALDQAKLTPAEIDKVLLVGGATRIPAVKELVRQLIGKEPDHLINPDEAVALGAAVRGSVSRDDPFGCCISWNVTPLSLGIETVGGVMTKIIPRNTIMLLRRSKPIIFSTTADGQTSVAINILQGERILAQDNKSLGILCLDGIFPAAKGVPKIEVTFEFDFSDNLIVSAKDQASGREASISVKGATYLPSPEIERIVRDAELSGAEDHTLREQIEARKKIDSGLSEALTQLNEVRNQVSADDQPLIDQLRKQLEDAIDRLGKHPVSLSDESQTSVRLVSEPIYAIAEETITSPSTAEVEVLNYEEINWELIDAEEIDADFPAV